MRPQQVLRISALIALQLLLSAWSFHKQEEKPSMEGAFAFSPDGQYLIFSIEYQNEGHIYRSRKDGSELTRLTHSPGKDFDANYSPDGSKIVFLRNQTSNFSDPTNIFVMDQDGANITQLTFKKTCDVAPVFSPDGQRIYFIRAKWLGHSSPMVSSFWQNKDLYSIELDGKNLKAITNESFYKMSNLSISPDGKEIITTLAIKNNPDFLWIIPIENPSARRALRPDLREFFPVKKRSDSIYQAISFPIFSPDGKSAAFKWSPQFRRYFNYDIYMMNVNTGATQRITNLGKSATPAAFSPDGKEIVFQFWPGWPRGNDPNELWLVNSDGTNPHKVSIDLNKCLNCT